MSQEKSQPQESKPQPPAPRLPEPGDTVEFSEFTVSQTLPDLARPEPAPKPPEE